MCADMCILICGCDFYVNQSINEMVKHQLLTDSEGTNLLDHLLKFLFFIFLESFVVFHRSHIQLMLGLGLRRLKRAGKNGNFSIFQNL